MKKENPMQSPKRGRGRPKVEARPGTVTASIRHVPHDVMIALHIYARQNHITVGEALAISVRKALELK